MTNQANAASSRTTQVLFIALLLSALAVVAFFSLTGDQKETPLAPKAVEAPAVTSPIVEPERNSLDFSGLTAEELQQRIQETKEETLQILRESENLAEKEEALYKKKKRLQALIAETEKKLAELESQ